jgi:hypothetical protein
MILSEANEVIDAFLLSASGRTSVCLSWIITDNHVGYESSVEIINAICMKVAWVYRIDATLKVIINMSKDLQSSQPAFLSLILCI